MTAIPAPRLPDLKPLWLRALHYLRPATLSERLLIINLVGIGAALVILSTLMLSNAIVSARADLLDDIRIQARVVAENIAPALMFRDRKAVQETLALLQQHTDIREAVVSDDQGNTFAQYLRGAGAPARAPGNLVDGHAWHADAVDLAQPIAVDGRESSTLRIQYDLSRFQERLKWYVLAIVVTGLLTFAITAVIMKKLIARAARPLTRLAELMERVSFDKDFSLRATVHLNDEVGALAKGFNQMLARIQKRDTALKHQLDERQRVERRLHVLAHYDALTDLHNRNYFNNRLPALLMAGARNNSAVALLLLDLDNFKIVNDTLGHQFGDMLLKHVAQRLRSSVRVTDTVCRLGGDEFTIILEENVDRAKVAHVAKKIVYEMSRPFVIGDHDVYVTCSVGISIFPQDGDDVSALIKNSDAAMYAAKERGKNNFQFFSAEMNAKALRRLRLETGLRQALENGRFKVHYQPQVDLRTGEVVGAEALLRWKHPSYGVIGPQEFIPIAEETGMIVPLGEWVLLAACSEANGWQRIDHAPVRVAVNISPRQFREPDFVRKVAHILEETQLEPSLLELEITESALMDDAESAISKAQDLRAMGVLLSIDDFGTGYSSMSHLRRFPVSELKIDRSFVSDIPANADDVNLVKAIIAMAHSLHVEVVAEGVEKVEQLQFLAAVSCDRAQGFYFGRGVPADEFARFIRTHDKFALPADAQRSLDHA